jgi:hypothetical protein
MVLVQRTVRDSHLSLAVSPFSKFNTDALPYFYRSLPNFRNGSINQLSVSLCRVADAAPCGGSPRRNQAGLIAKAR